MNRPRPLSPHLSIWKWRASMAVSIMHRVSGHALALAGALLFAWWLAAAANGPDAYQRFLGIAGSPLGWVVWVGLSWMAFQHLCSGIRHLVMDSGAGFDLDVSRRSAVAAFVVALLLTAAFWALWFAGRSGL